MVEVSIMDEAILIFRCLCLISNYNWKLLPRMGTISMAKFKPSGKQQNVTDLLCQGCYNFWFAVCTRLVLQLFIGSRLNYE